MKKKFFYSQEKHDKKIGKNMDLSKKIHMRTYTSIWSHTTHTHTHTQHQYLSSSYKVIPVNFLLYNSGNNNIYGVLAMCETLFEDLQIILSSSPFFRWGKWDTANKNGRAKRPTQGSRLQLFTTAHPASLFRLGTTFHNQCSYAGPDGMKHTPNQRISYGSSAFNITVKF